MQRYPNVYYKLVEHNPEGWDDTTLALSIGAVHYGSIVLNDTGMLRKFVINIEEDDLIFLKLRFSHHVSFEAMDANEISLLRHLGYIK